MIDGYLWKNHALPFASSKWLVLKPGAQKLHLYFIVILIYFCIETMHKLVHMVNFNTSVQALTLLFQILDSRDSVNDRCEANCLWSSFLVDLTD